MNIEPIKPRHSWIAAAVVVGAIALFAVWRIQFGSWQPEARETLRIGAFSGEVGALAWIAKEQGFFERVGLDADMRGFDTGKDAIDALRADVVDVAAASEFVVADRGFAETDLRVLASMCRYWNKGLIGRRDHGIAGPAGLKGKRIGVSLTSTAEQTLVVFLAMQGLTADDVEIVDLPPRQLVEQIGTGAIDAAIAWQPHVDAIERRLSANAVSLMRAGSDAYLAAVTRADLLPAKDEAFKRFLRGLLLAQDWVRSDHPRAKKWLAARFSLGDDYVEKTWPHMSFSVALPQEILEIMDGEARWLATKKKTAVLPDFGRTVAAVPLMAVKPEAVTVSGRSR